jgi:outer membrane protein assembly factor BamB
MAASLAVAAVTALLAGTGAASAAPAGWPTFAFDAQRDGVNPFESTLSPTSARMLVRRWSTALAPAGWETVTQPVVAKGVRLPSGRTADLVLVGTEGGVLAALNLQTGAIVWQRQLPTTIPGAKHGCPAYPTLEFGISGTPVVDPAAGRVYVVAGDMRAYALTLAAGRTARGWPLQVGAPASEHTWGALALSRGALYVPVASYCDLPPYTGKVVGIDVAHARRFATWRPTQRGTGRKYPSGGGVWGWGGVSVDPAGDHVFAATGNALGHNQSAGYSEHVVRLSRHLTVEQSNYPFARSTLIDQDFGSTPMLYRPTGCPPLLTALNKDGELFVYDRGHIGRGPLQRIQIAAPSDEGNDSLLGVTAYNASRRLVYVASPSDSPDGAYRAGLIAFSVGPACRLSLAWQTAIGSSGLTSAPVVANGVVYVGTGSSGEVVAVDGASGNLLAIEYIGTQTFAAPTPVNGSLLVSANDGVVRSYRPPAALGP